MGCVEQKMTTLMLDASTTSRPYASLRATIGITIILQNFRKCLKARLWRNRSFPIGQDGKRKSRVTSQLADGSEPRRSHGVPLSWPRFSNSQSRDLWFKSLLNELDKYTRIGKPPLWETAADEKIFLHHDLAFAAKYVDLADVAHYFSIVTAVLGRLKHYRQHASAKSPFTLRSENQVEEVGDLEDEKFVANLEHLLRCLEQLLYHLLIQKTVELLDLEALYRQQHLDDELFAETPGRRQQLSSTWPWSIRTALLVLWGVCWMFFDSSRSLSKTAQSIFLEDLLWGYSPTDDPDTLGAGAQPLAVDLGLTPNTDGNVVVPPTSTNTLSWQAPSNLNVNLNLSEPLIIRAAPQPIRQPGHENEQGNENNEDGEPPFSLFNSKGCHQPGGHKFSNDLYNHDRQPQDSFVSAFGTAPASIWPDTSGSSLSNLSIDALPSQDNQPHQSSLPVRGGVPLLTLQPPNADFLTVPPYIYSPVSSWDVRQSNLQNLEEEYYDSSMPDSDNYPSPASDGSGGQKDISRDRRPIIMSINNLDPSSPSSVGSAVRPRMSLKRDQEPPRNEGGQITCIHQDCSHGKPPTFQRKCEWSKHMDKHDRPYICTESGCEKIRGFTYSGGLLRHQREVHKKHGGPIMPLMCPHQDCKRSTGKGFTRRENFVEHLRRVHRKDAPDDASIDEQRMDADQHEDDAEADSPPAMSRKRKRSPDDFEARPVLSAPSTLPDEGGGDLREEVKRLKCQNDETDRRLRDLEAFVATLKQQMQR